MHNSFYFSLKSWSYRNHQAAIPHGGSYIFIYNPF